MFYAQYCSFLQKLHFTNAKRCVMPILKENILHFIIFFLFFYIPNNKPILDFCKYISVFFSKMQGATNAAVNKTVKIRIFSCFYSYFRMELISRTLPDNKKLFSVRAPDYILFQSIIFVSQSWKVNSTGKWAIWIFSFISKLYYHLRGRGLNN